MTGSGKTRLCIALLEEAAIDGIPAIVIDPKGDLADLLPTFPDLKPEDFLPWVNEDDPMKGLSTRQYAAQQAELWRKGLGDWDRTHLASLGSKAPAAKGQRRADKSRALPRIFEGSPQDPQETQE